jgi:hypothetical protein
MKQIFITIFLICFTGLLQASDLKIYQDNKLVGTMTVQQFESIVKGAEKYKEIIEAQKKDRIDIELLEPVRQTETDGEYATQIKISWKDEKNKEINFIKIYVVLNIDNDTADQLPQWKIIYRDIASYSFPFVSSLFILLIIIL